MIHLCPLFSCVVTAVLSRSLSDNACVFQMEECSYLIGGRTLLAEESGLCSYVVRDV